MANSTSWEEARKDFKWAVQWRTPGGKIERFRYETRRDAFDDVRGYGPDAYVVHKEANGQWYRVSA